MKAVIRIGVIIVCFSAFLSIFGCKAHILDGPGMVNKAQWTGFTLSRSDSYAQHNFYFDVKDNDEGAFVTGSCRDAEGNIYEVDDGIPVPPETIDRLRQLGIDELEEIPKQEKQQPEQTDGMEEYFLLDDSSVKLTVLYYTELYIDKVVTYELSLQIYEILLPLFIEQYAE